MDNKKKNENNDSIPISKPIESKAVSKTLTDEEKALIAEHKKQEKASQSPAFMMGDGKTVCEFQTYGNRGTNEEKIALFHAAVSKATGSKCKSFAINLWMNCVLASGLEKANGLDFDKTSNSILDALHALKPADEIEGMLVIRLISIHFQLMRYLTYATDKEITDQKADININRATKLSRVYNETLEQLMRYRRKGEQRVTVQHVQVNGQAILSGNIDAFCKAH